MKVEQRNDRKYLGDELSLMLVTDNELHDALKRLSPIHYFLDVTRPGKISSNAKIPSPALATVANWLHEYD